MEELTKEQEDYILLDEHEVEDDEVEK